MRTPLRQWSGAVLAIALAVLSALENADAQPVLSISVEAPHGGCRLTWLENGKGAIRYGAAPWQVSVAPGTFRFHELAEHLRENSYAQRDRAARGDMVGSVTLPGSSELRLIDDARVVRPLLERAWVAHLAPTPPFESEERQQWIASACGFGRSGER